MWSFCHFLLIVKLSTTCLQSLKSDPCQNVLKIATDQEPEVLNPYCRTQLLPPRTSSTTLACATCLVATTTSTMQDSPGGFWRWRPINPAKKRSGANSLSSGGGRVDLLHLPLGLPWHSQRHRPRFEEPKVGEPLILLKTQSKRVYFSHHEHDPTGSLEMIPENCPLDPVPCSWS